MPAVKITEVRDVAFRDTVAMMTVDLDNNDSYQLRISPDGIGNVYVWVDHRTNGKWSKLVELVDGKQR